MGQKNTRHLEKKILESTDRLIECAIAASLLEHASKDKELERGVALVSEITSYLKELIDVKEDYLPEVLGQIISQKLPDAKIQDSLGTFNMELERILRMGFNAMGQKPDEDFQPQETVGEREDKARVETDPETAIEAGEDTEEKRDQGRACDKTADSGEEPARFIDAKDNLTQPSEVDRCKDAKTEDREQLEEISTDQDTVAALAAVTPSPAVQEKPARGLELSLKLIFPGIEILKDAYLDGVIFDFYLPDKMLALDQTVSEEDYVLKNEICNQEGITYLVIAPEESKNPRRVERILLRKRIIRR